MNERFEQHLIDGLRRRINRNWQVTTEVRGDVSILYIWSMSFTPEFKTSLDSRTFNQPLFNQWLKDRLVEFGICFWVNYGETFQVVFRNGGSIDIEVNGRNETEALLKFVNSLEVSL